MVVVFPLALARRRSTCCCHDGGELTTHGAQHRQADWSEWQTLNPRAGFLSSYEVYTVLRRQREQREQDVKQLLREKSAVMKPYNRAVAEQKQQIEDEEKAEAERKATEEKEGKSGKRKQHQQQAADKKEKPKPIPMPARRFDEELERIQPSDLNTVTFEVRCVLALLFVVRDLNPGASASSISSSSTTPCASRRASTFLTSWRRSSLGH